MNIKDVEDLAILSRLDLTTEEKEQLLQNTEGILNYVKVIEGVEVPDIEVEYEQKNVWREDVLRVGEPDFSHDLIVSQFPDSQDGFLKVKKIL